MGSGNVERSLVAVGQRSLDIDGLQVLVDDVEGHTGLHALHQMATLRIERHLQVVLLWLLQTGLRTLVHAAGIIVAGFLGLTINR